MQYWLNPKLQNEYIRKNEKKAKLCVGGSVVVKGLIVSLSELGSIKWWGWKIKNNMSIWIRNRAEKKQFQESKVVASRKADFRVGRSQAGKPLFFINLFFFFLKKNNYEYVLLWYKYELHFTKKHWESHFVLNSKYIAIFVYFGHPLKPEIQFSWCLHPLSYALTRDFFCPSPSVEL